MCRPISCHQVGGAGSAPQHSVARVRSCVFTGDNHMYVKGLGNCGGDHPYSGDIGIIQAGAPTAPHQPISAICLRHSCATLTSATRRTWSINPNETVLDTQQRGEQGRECFPRRLRGGNPPAEAEEVITAISFSGSFPPKEHNIAHDLLSNVGEKAAPQRR